MSHFFINRPIFATVLSIVITFAGMISAVTLPVAQYPEITPPTVQVTAVYPGAGAEVLADTVAAPIEQQVNGVENMLYMSSRCSNDGNYSLDVTFKLGTDLDTAQVLVQNRVQLATPTLPETVRVQGVSVKKRSPSILLVVNMVSPDGTYDQLRLSNYATIYIKDELARVPGVGDVNYMGQRDYSMRFWLDPDRLAQLDITAIDVANAIKEQNVQVAAGQIGSPPISSPLAFQYTMTTLGRLKQVEQFENIVVKSQEESNIRVRDVARVELGSKSYDVGCGLDGDPSVGLAIYQLPGSNALTTAQGIKDTMERLKKRFPSGVDYKIVYDTTPFIEQSIHEVYKTLMEAVVLVALVTVIFLQNWRSTLIPLIAVPVSIVGTFAAMAIMNYSLNNLTLLGLVLAIGIVVDDAIVVVESVESWMARGNTPREAAHKAMDEVSGPLMAMALVLCCVFVPCVFITGITGQFFRQFAVTIAVSTVISFVNSLTLSPALAALFLKPHAAPAHEGDNSKPHTSTPRPGLLTLLGVGALGGLAASLLLAGFIGEFLELEHGNLRDRIVPGVLFAGGFAIALPVFIFFNQFFALFTSVYMMTVSGFMRLCIVVLLIYVGLLGATGITMTNAPTGFIPDQDKGYLLVNLQMPDATSIGNTTQVIGRMDRLAHSVPGVAHTLTVPGQSFLLNANNSNFGSMFIILKPFDKRHGHQDAATAVLAELRKRFKEEIPDGAISVFGAPAVDGLGNAGGFKIMVEDRGDVGLVGLEENTNKLARKAAEAGMVGMFSSFKATTPQLRVDVDREKCKAMGVHLSDVYQTLQIYLGSQYVNDFNLYGRTWQVVIQAASEFRDQPDKVKLLRVRNAKGEMVPLGSLATIENSVGPLMVLRYNSYTSTAINGGPAPGTSTGQAIAKMEQLADKELPRSMAFEWTEITLLQILAGNTALIVFALAVVLVFLVLAAQYESWSLPLAVILVVPMCLLCSTVGVLVGGFAVDIFTQIGFVVLVALASKNAILIVEFAKERREHGMSTWDATLDGCRQRFRPILMTSFAFVLGVVPLMLGHGAGAEMRKTLGTAVFAGMLGVTIFGVLLTPVFFYVLQRLFPGQPVRVLPGTHGTVGTGAGEAVVHVESITAASS